MAVFATRAIRAGDELTHSYLPLAVLARPATHRQPHLHFACRCVRCEAEADVEAEAEAEAEAASSEQADADGEGGCRLPTTAAEERLAFHVSCAAGDWANALGEGEAVLRQARPLLAASPHAALDFSHAYLGAHWALHAAGEGGGAAPAQVHSAARLHAEAAAALSDAAGEAAPHRAQLALLRHLAATQAAALGALTPAEARLGPALACLAASLGGSHGWLRDDLPLLSAEAAELLRAEARRVQEPGARRVREKR